MRHLNAFARHSGREVHNIISVFSPPCRPKRGFYVVYCLSCQASCLLSLSPAACSVYRHDITNKTSSLQRATHFTYMGERKLLVSCVSSGDLRRSLEPPTLAPWHFTAALLSCKFSYLDWIRTLRNRARERN